MVTSCPNCGMGVAPDARFCAACGAKLATATEAPREVRKVVTVLFADVTGSTALGERLDPEAMRGLMNRYFARIRVLIEAHGGTVEKFIGDAVMAVFGIPQVHEDDALRAVRAAAEIREALAAMNEELVAERGIAIRFRTGVNTGEVVAGAPASGTTLVTGDAVNSAARLEQAAPPGEVLLGRLTYTLVRDAVDAEAVAPIEAKGKAQPMEAWRLVGVHAGAEGRARHRDAPLVGRERELERLTSAYRSAVADRSCTLFTLLGSAGVGKSRLTAEFLASVSDEATVLRGRCLSYGEGITYWPIGEIVREAAGITEADDAGAANAKVRSLLEGDREADDLADRISAAIGLSAAQSPQEEVFWAVRRLIEHLAADRPLVLVIEDIHWAERTLLELIEHVADWARDAAILVLCPARPELLDEHPGWGGGKLNATSILLEPLPGEAVTRLIEALPGGSALPVAIADGVAAAAEGNPLYIEELLAMLIDDGLLAMAEDGVWRASPNVEDVPIPPSISLLLAARLERLAPAERQVAERASVVGRVFEQAAVVELSGDEARPGVPAMLLALVRKELVRPERGDMLTRGLAFKFRHVLIRDAAYEALPKAERATLHVQVADWLIRVAGDRLAEVEEIVGYHLARGHDYRAEFGETGPDVDRLAARASHHLAAAGIRADERRDAGTCVTLLRRAIALNRAPTAETEELRLRLAGALFESGALREAVTLDEEVRAWAVASGSDVLHARATMAAIRHRPAIGDPAPASEAYATLLEEAAEVIARIGDPRAAGMYWRIVATHHWNAGRYLESRTANQRALPLAELAGDPTGVQELLQSELVELASGPTPLDAVLERTRELLGHPGLNRMMHAQILASQGLVEGMLGVAEGRDHLTAAIAALHDLGRRVDAASVVWYRSWLERLDGNFEREAAFLRDTLVDDEPHLAPFYNAGLALALAKLGRFDEASGALALTGNDAWYRTKRLHALAGARLDVAGGRMDTALRAADALEREVAGETFALGARSELLVETGVIAALAGDDGTAARRAAMALETAERKGNVALAAKARALLAGDLSRL
jgi:class 3 adenylate cyclase